MVKEVEEPEAKWEVSQRVPQSSKCCKIIIIISQEIKKFWPQGSLVTFAMTLLISK